MEEKNKTKISEWKIFQYKSIILNLVIFIFAVSILLGRSEVIESQNRYTEIWHDYYSQQTRYREVVTQTNLISLISVILLAYAGMSTYFMFEDKKIESKIVEIIISKVKSKEDFMKNIKKNSKNITITLTILTVIIGVYTIYSNDSFFHYFKQEFEIFQQSKTNSLLLKFQGNNLEYGFKNVLLYIFIICYILMFTMWEIFFQEQRVKEEKEEI